jgi:ferrochelatase
MISLKTGVLLINVGTPESPTRNDVKKYLGQFLSDKRMINLPGIIRYPLVHALIAPLRSGKSAHSYQQVWSAKSGSPLLHNSVLCKDKLASALGDDFIVELGMRYGKPSIKFAVDSLLAHCNRILLLPMFPQYASATTASALEEVFSYLNKQYNIPSITTVNDFYSESGFIKSLNDMFEPFISDSSFEHIVLSYHGLPVKQIEDSEDVTPKACYLGKPCPSITNENRYCYRAQCFETTRLLASELNISLDKFSTVFQSRVGPVAWIEPSFTDKLHELAGKNIKNIIVACPSFTADCLETLEEINIKGQAQWKKLGGENFTMVPCLNDSDSWIQALKNIVASHIGI